MPLTLFQIILIIAGPLGLAAGSVLLGRVLRLPGFQPTPTTVGRLAYWPLSGIEFVLLVIMILFFGALCLAVGGTLFSEAIKAAGARSGLKFVVEGCAFQGGGLLAWLVFAVFRRQLFASYQTTPPSEPAAPQSRLGWGRVFLTGGGAFLISFPLVLLVGWTWRQALALLGVPADPQDAIEIFRSARDPLILAGMHLVACVLAPINEELLFRRGLFHFLRQRIGRYLALGASAVCFGAIHANLAGFLPLSVLGVVLAAAYERTGDVRVPIVAHALFNLNTLVLIQAGLSD